MPRVLVVDDEPHITRVLKMGLSKHGYEVVVAYDGEQAQARLEEQHFDVVITDLNMPRVDGEDLCRSCVSNKRTRPRLVMMVTGRSESMQGDWLSDSVAFRLLEKPVSLRVLLKHLGEFFPQTEPTAGIGTESRAVRPATRHAAAKLRMQSAGIDPKLAGRPLGDPPAGDPPVGLD
ncbi:MAG: response regulator [Gammaproteobacteria bacterium]|nr:response regulator [Gammaproteobacteria bacterium]